MALKKFDFPDPFAPTTVLIDGLNGSIVTWSL